MKQRQSYVREIAQILGSYSLERDIVLAHPRDLGMAMDEFVLQHEAIHKLLTMGTLFGFFERAVFLMQNEVPESSLLREIVPELLDQTWATHEGSASYAELCLCAVLQREVEDHLNSFPDDYIAALEPFLATLGLPTEALAPYQWMAAVLLAKIAMNGAVLDDFSTPSRLTRDRFQASMTAGAPDVRLRKLCRALQRAGVVDYVLPRLSREVEATWQRLLPGLPVARMQSGSGEIVDLRPIGGTLDSPGREVGEHAEWNVMRLLASVDPELPVTIGGDEMQTALRDFASGWSSASPTMAKAVTNIVVGAPGTNKNVRDRHYAVRYRLDAHLPKKSLDDLRAFLTAQAERKLMTLAGFVETVHDEVAVFAATTEGVEPDASHPIRVREAWVAVLPLIQIYDFIPLRLMPEPYAAFTGWHVPLEVAFKYNFPNVAHGLHGAVLRSVPGFNEQFLKDLVENWIRQGYVLYMRHVQVKNLSAIVIESIADDVPWINRSAAAPSFAACLGSRREARHIFDMLGGEDPILGLRVISEPERSARLLWSGPERQTHTALLTALLDVGYNLDSFGATFLPGRLVPA